MKKTDWIQIPKIGTKLSRTQLLVLGYIHNLRNIKTKTGGQYQFNKTKILKDLPWLSANYLKSTLNTLSKTGLLTRSRIGASKNSLYTTHLPPTTDHLKINKTLLHHSEFTPTEIIKGSYYIALQDYTDQYRAKKLFNYKQSRYNHLVNKLIKHNIIDREPIVVNPTEHVKTVDLPPELVEQPIIDNTPVYEPSEKLKGMVADLLEYELRKSGKWVGSVTDNQLRAHTTTVRQKLGKYVAYFNRIWPELVAMRKNSEPKVWTDDEVAAVCDSLDWDL